MKTLRTLLTWGLLSAAVHVMGYSLSVSPIEIEAGQTANLIINLDDAPDNFTAYQMMVYLPEGVTVQKKTNGKYAYTANADRHDGNFTITVKDAADGSVLIACFSADKDVLTGASGELIRLPLEVASTVTTSLQGSIKNIEFSDVNNNAYNPADVNFTMTLKGGSTPPDVSGDVTASVPDIEMSAGSTTNLIVNMQTSLTNVTAYQLMVYLPEGVTVQKKTNGKYAYTANADRHDGNFTITVKDAADGSVLIACFSADKDVLTGTSGELIRLPLEVASTVTTSLQGSIKNIEFSDVNNNAYNPADVNFTMTLKEPVSQNITFADPAVKALCVANWDTNGDGELSEAEAAAVTDLGKVFKGNTEITSFNELQYFTGLTRNIYSAFLNCSRLTSVVIPESVTSIGSEAFYGCSSLTSVVIPESVTSIGYHAFYSCNFLTSIIIPNSVTSISESAFFYSGLTSVAIPESVTSIGTKAFWGCNRLTSVTISQSVISIGEKAFSNCRKLSTVAVESGNAVYDSRNNCNAIIETASNTLIAGCMNTIIPESVTNIGAYAFSECEEMTSVTVPDGVINIGYRAFESCQDLTSVTISNSVTSIGNEAFYDCHNMTSVIIGNGVTSIGRGAFNQCSSLTSITIPNSVTDIQGHLFSRCSGLTSIVVETGNTIYDSRDNCNAIIETATNTLVSGCKNTIIPESVTSIGNSAFVECYYLTSISIPENVTSIDPWAFRYCLHLTSVTIGNGVTSIGHHAFEHCGLTTVTIGSGVTSIGDYAFTGCSSLQSIICYAIETPEVYGYAFTNIAVSNITLRVPKVSEQKYKEHPVWGKFKIEVITGIDEVEDAMPKAEVEDAIYDLSGKAVNGNLPHGIYIRNGKKVAVK